MKKHLQILALIAAFCMPWVSQAQGTAITSFPWSCDFEDATVNAAWTFSNASNGWYVGTATSNGGTHSLYVSDNNGTANSYSGSACVSYAYLTLDIASAGQYALSFDWKCNGESTFDFLRVAVATATTALPSSYSDWTATSVPSNFLAVDGGSKLNLQGSIWQNYVTTISVPAAGTYRLIFVWRNDASVYNVPPAAIDNVQIAELTCPQPTELSCLPTPDQLDFTWTAGGSESAWRVVFNDSVDEDVYTNSYSVTGLTANTPYNFKVYSLCDAGDTSFATQGTFRTACDYLTALPYAYGFEDAATGSSTTGSPFVDCWNRLNNGTSYGGYPYVGSSTYAHTGSKGLYWYNTTTAGTYGDYECVVLPPTDPDLYSVNTLQLRFWAKSSSTTTYPVFQVGVMTDPGDISTFTPVGTVNVSGTSWQEYMVSLGAYTGTGNRVAVKSSRASWTAYVDDFRLEVANVVTSDTLAIHDTITIHDTVNVPYFVHDTLFVHDTVTLYDTVGADLIYHSIELMSRDLTRGMVAGKGVFPEGTAVEIAAVPIRGNKFVRWSDGSTQQIRTVTVDGDISLTASFESLGRVGIDDIMETAFEVSAEQGTIVVKDAMGEGVRVFDVSGRLLYQGRVETEVWRLGVSTSGTYFVQIADSPAQKVVVMR